MISTARNISLLMMAIAIAQGCGSAGGSGGSGSPAPTSNNTTVLPPSESAIDPQEPDIDTSATSFYFSYDESGSTASRDLTFKALADGNLPSADWGRPYEYLNAEEFNHFDLTVADPINVSMGLYAANTDEIPVGIDFDGSLYALGINVTGPVLNHSERDNVVLTLLVDISGSMGAPYTASMPGNEEIRSLLDVAKHGLLLLETQLKEGDVVNLVSFESFAVTHLKSWAYSADDTELREAISALNDNGSTALNAGIQQAYAEAIASFDPEKSNRVIILTDAKANVGEVNPTLISQNVTINDAEGIHFSGIGIGANFDDRFLNTLTDLGKGNYSAMITPNDTERIFDRGFMRFLQPAIRNVKFELTYPQSLNQLYSAAEDISQDAEEVSSVNFSYNSSQFFLELFNATNFVDPEETIDLTLFYKNHQGEDLEVTVSKPITELLQVGESEIKSAAAVTTLAQLVARQISCSQATQSSLYEQDIRTYTFEKYKQGIEDYCEQFNR